jgi:hypothetical protein
MQLRELFYAAPLFGAFVFIAADSSAADSRFERSLRRLDPITRLEQVCDYTAMTEINHARNPFHPDRVVGNATLKTRINGDMVKAEGGAFRSRGKWYELSYTCKATPDHMKVVSFDYRIGPEIPQEKWAAYELWR